MSEKPAPDVVESDKSWWMIERQDLKPSPQYYRQDSPRHHSWVSDWSQGTRYTTREGAEAETNGDPLLFVVEHGYMQAALQARPDSALDAALAGELERVFDQFRSDLKSAHAVICKLQGLDPETHGWPEWSPPANTLRWLDKLQPKFLSALRTHDDTLEDAAMIPAEVYEFLMGTGPLEGCHFGDKPEGERGNFWWRKYLRNLKGKAKP